MGQRRKRKETKGRQIGDCNLRGMDSRGVQGSGRTNNGKNGTARRNGRGEVGRASVGGGKRWRRRGGEGSGGGKAEAECNEFEKSGALRLHT